jgi:hypothetical protein
MRDLVASLKDGILALSKLDNKKRPSFEVNLVYHSQKGLSMANAKIVWVFIRKSKLLLQYPSITAIQKEN